MRMLIWICALLAASVAPMARAEQSAGPSAPTSNSLAEWLDSVGLGLARSAESMSLLTDRLMAAVAAPAAASTLDLPPAEAERASADLVAVYREYVELRMAQSTLTGPALIGFAENPTPAQWERVKVRLRITRDSIRRVDAAIASLGPSFTLSPLYPELRENLAARGAALDAIAGAPPPRTPEELAAYKRMVGSYMRLLDEMGRLAEAFRTYAAAQSARNAPRSP